MALSEPFDILAEFPGWTTSFAPRMRQEQSTSAAGRTYVKDLGPALWTATHTSRALKPTELEEWRARLEALAGTQQTFLGYSLARCWPTAYPRGTWPTGGAFSGTAALAVIAPDRKTIQVDGLPAGFRLTVGDLIRIGASDLHRLRQAALAGGGGETGDFEIWPNLWPGVIAGAAVSVRRPHCLMTVVPGSVSALADMATGRGTIAFQGMEAR